MGYSNLTISASNRAVAVRSCKLHSIIHGQGSKAEETATQILLKPRHCYFTLPVLRLGPQRMMS